jgi:hypothetical protein
VEDRGAGSTRRLRRGGDRGAARRAQQGGCVILGRGPNEAGIIGWLRAAAAVPEFMGFAIGRTSFWDALVALCDNKTTRRRSRPSPTATSSAYLRGRAQGLTVTAKWAGGPWASTFDPAKSSRSLPIGKRCYHHGSVLERSPLAREPVRLRYGLFHRATTRRWLAGRSAAGGKTYSIDRGTNASVPSRQACPRVASATLERVYQWTMQ